ncbi:MAG: dihydrodipicolinate synthase family protein [Candidatus Rokubacteria bacterium]|nr:dihydrodipicolinate synthase family protein [Candidatus Rokubacteria bacterium]
MRTLDVEGYLAAPVLPMRDDGAIDLDRMERYVRWIADDGPKAMVVNSSAGEGELLYPEERAQVLGRVVQAVGSRLPVVTGIISEFTEEAVAQARSASRAGAAGLLVFPPRAFGGEGLPARSVVEYHRAIIEASGLPVIVFHRPAQFGGVVYAAETLRLLAEVEGVVGLKEASFDASRFIQIVRVNRTFPRPLKILTGNDTFIYESYLLGAAGALLGMGATATALQIAMLDAVRRGDLMAGAALRDRLDPLCQAIYAAPLRNYRVRMKEALVFQGVLKNAVVRAPLPPATDEERAAVRSALVHAGLL